MEPRLPPALGPDGADHVRQMGASQSPVDAQGSRGVQFNQGGENLQVNTYIVPPLSESGGVRQATAEEFRTDVVALLSKLDEASCRANLPIYLPPGADLTQMARTVRLLGRVRRPPNDDEFTSTQTSVNGTSENLDLERIYALPAERDDRADEPPQPWDRVIAAHERLVVLADPGMGKSWLVRTETHRLAQVALESLADPNAIVENVVIPIPIRADVLANSPGQTLAEAASGYLTEYDLLPQRSREAIHNRITGGGIVLLVDALDEVPRDPSTPGAQSPRRRLEDLLRHWADRSTEVARFVLTTRLAGYSGPPVPGVREVELLPFTLDDA